MSTLISPEIDVSPSPPTDKQSTRDYLPPLLRGIGTTLVMLGAVIALLIARRDIEAQRLKREAARQQTAAVQPANPNLDSLTKEVEELKSEVSEESLAEEVFENRWFEWMSILGTAVLASSFYTEAILRKSKDA